MLDISKYVRRMRINYIMHDKDSDDFIHPFRTPSKWVPKTSGNTFLEEYLSETQFELSKIQAHKVVNNMSKAETEALTRLSKNPNVVLKPFDKGRGICILPTDAYRDTAQRHLQGKHYTPIPTDPTQETVTLVKQTIDNLHQAEQIDEQTHAYLNPHNRQIKIPCLYLLRNYIKTANLQMACYSSVGPYYRPRQVHYNPWANS